MMSSVHKLVVGVVGQDGVVVMLDVVFMLVDNAMSSVFISDIIIVVQSSVCQVQ